MAVWMSLACLQAGQHSLILRFHEAQEKAVEWVSFFNSNLSFYYRRYAPFGYLNVKYAYGSFLFACSLEEEAENWNEKIEALDKVVETLENVRASFVINNFFTASHCLEA